VTGAEIPGDTAEKRDLGEVEMGTEILDTERVTGTAAVVEIEVLGEAVADNAQDQVIEEVPVPKVRN